MNTPDSLPFSEDAERGLLHCMLLRSVLETYTELPAPAFYVPAHTIVFRQLREMLAKEIPIEWQVLVDRLNVAGQLAEVGGLDALNTIWGFADTSGDHKYYSGVILDCYRRRVAILELKELTAKLYDRRSDVDASISEHVERTLTALSLSSQKPERTFRSIVLDTLDILEARQTDAGASGIKFGIPTLDAELSGLQPSEQCVVAGSTSSGKSALSSQAVLENAKKGGASALFSLEMSAVRVVTRMIAHLGQISMKSLKSGLLTEIELGRMMPTVKRLSDYKIFLEDQYASEIGSIVSRCRILKTKHQISLVVVDYLQLVDSSNGRNGDRHERLVADVSRSLRRMAKELDLVVIGLSQLTDDGKLRDCRAIGHDADVILRIEDSQSDNSFTREIVIDKHRDGERGKRIPVRFYGQYMRFQSVLD